jgi:hypothetical protein
MSANGAIFITPTVQWTKENKYILFRLQEEGGWDYTPRFMVESLICWMWRSRSRFSFKKHINASLFTAHSCSILIHVCLPRCEWQLPISQSSLALPANHMEDLGTCSIFCESTSQRRTVLCLCWATWVQVPAPYVHNELGPGRGGRGTPVTCF